MKNKYLVILKIVSFILMITSGITASGSAAIPSRYNIDMQYDATQAVIPEHLKAEGKMRGLVIAVAELTDVRQAADKRIIGHVREIGDTKVPVFQKNDLPAKAVANGIKSYLKKAGYKVADKMVQWDLKEGTLPKKSGKIIISGSIDELEVSCWTGVFSNDYKANVKLTLVVADSIKSTILYKGTVSVALSKTDVSFSEGQLGRQAGIALGDAIEKLFEGKTVAQKIKEAIIP